MDKKLQSKLSSLSLIYLLLLALVTRNFLFFKVLCSLVLGFKPGFMLNYFNVVSKLSNRMACLISNLHLLNKSFICNIEMF